MAVYAGFRTVGGGGGLTAEQEAALALLSASGGTLTVDGDLAVTGTAPASGVWLPESVSTAALAAGLPARWYQEPLAAGSGLTAGQWQAATASGRTFYADKDSNKWWDWANKKLPNGIYCPFYGTAIDVVAHWDGIAFPATDDPASGERAVWLALRGADVPVSGGGGLFCVRGVYNAAAGDSAANPGWFGNVRHAAASKTNSATSVGTLSATYIQTARKPDPSDVLLRIAGNLATGFKGYVSGTAAAATDSGHASWKEINSTAINTLTAGQPGVWLATGLESATEFAATRTGARLKAIHVLSVS